MIGPLSAIASFINEKYGLRVISQVGSRDGGVYTASSLPFEDKDIVFDRPSTQVKHNRIKFGKEDNGEEKSSTKT